MQLLPKRYRSISCNLKLTSWNTLTNSHSKWRTIHHEIATVCNCTTQVTIITNLFFIVVFHSLVEFTVHQFKASFLRAMKEFRLVALAFILVSTFCILEHKLFSPSEVMVMRRMSNTPQGYQEWDTKYKYVKVVFYYACSLDLVWNMSFAGFVCLCVFSDIRWKCVRSVEMKIHDFEV